MMSAPNRVDTLIVGGGISGLAAGRRFINAGFNDFRIVTDQVGGRMFHSDNPHMNFGATYINDDYKNVLNFVAKGQRLRISEVFATNGEKLVQFLSVRNLRYLPQGLRVFLICRRLRAELNRFRLEAIQTPQNELLPKFALITELASISAFDFVERNHLQTLDRNYFRYCFWATVFAKTSESNALFYLGVLFPLIIPTYVADFRNTYSVLTSGFTENIVTNKVVNLRRTEGGYEAKLRDNSSISARNVIIAAPYHNAVKFYDVPKPHLAKPATVLYVRGERQGKFEGKNFMLLNPDEASIGLVWRQHDAQMDLIFSLEPNPDLSLYYSNYEVVRSVSWKTAVVLSDGNWVNMRLHEDLFLAGDYNICGLEDSFISGVCAANQVLARQC